MYHEETLFIASIVAAALFFLLTTYIIALRKSTRLLKEIVKRETEPFDALGATMQSGVGDTVTFAQTDLTDESIHSMSTLPNNKVSFQPDLSEIYSVKLKSVEDIDIAALDGQYTLLGELESGGMGRVFLARKNNVGNDWIIKYVPRHIGRLTKEADILKSLNHPSLPQVIDIFISKNGLFIVQSHIPGITMQSVLDALKTESVADTSVIPEFKLLDWACQLTEVLAYLHTREQPVFHFDLKPSNLMVSLGNKLSLIDFGISKRQSDDPVIEAITFEYAAPEQLKALPQLVEYVENIMWRRFGGIRGLPESRKEWLMDERTDIYSLGVVLFEATVGEIPSINNRGLLRRLLSKGLCDIIEKCLELNPLDRYQSSSELLKSLHLQASIGKQKILATLWKRKSAKILSVIMMAVATMTLVTGLFSRVVGAAAVMYAAPEIITVSVLQASEVTITRVLPESRNAFLSFLINSDEEQLLDPNQLNWETEANHIVQVDGNRVIGLNVGETTIYAQYRGQRIAVRVYVVEAMENMVDISMRFQSGHFMWLFAGSSYREHVDGNVAYAEFVSPESMDATYNGAVYFTDAGLLRRLQNGLIETINIDPAYIRAFMVRTFQNDVYILTDIWQDDDENFYGIMRYTGDGFEMLYYANAHFTAIRDFIVAEETIYFIERNNGVEATYLRTIDRQNTSDIRTLAVLPLGTSAITYGDSRIYLADKADGTLLYYKQGQLTNLAGTPDERAFIDGTAPLFYRPTRIRYYDNAIYIWDFNTLRKVFLEDGAVREAISLAGVASPVFSMNLETQMPAEDIVLPHSQLADFVISELGFFLTDPRRGVIWRFE